MELIGKTLGGCKITELIGKGAMGEVYRATQLSLERDVAIKILARHYAEDEEFRKRFIREARSIAKVNHPNILQIYEVAEQDNINFMVMELINGQTMADILEKRGFIEWSTASEFAKQAALGLQNASEVNIIHRDIKPDNLMVTNSGIVKVSDFGLAKECNSELTQTNTVMGTPAYMSPEQCDGEDLDTRTDIYSLGATLYRVTTGVLPFTAPTAVSMMYKHKHEEPVPPQKYMPSIPKRLEKLILAMMEKEKDKRPQTMAAVSEELDGIIKDIPVNDNSEMTMKISDQNNSFDFDAAPAKPADDFMINPTDELLAESEKYMKNHRPIAAYNCLKKALELQPDNTNIRNKLEKAKEESTVASIKIGEKLLEHGKLSQIRAELHEKIKNNPDDTEAMEKLQALDFMDQQKRKMTNDIRKKLGAEKYEDALALWEKIPEPMREKSLADNINHIKNKVLPVQKLVTEIEHLNKGGKLDEALAKIEEAAGIDENEAVAKLRQQVNHKIASINNLMREGAEAEINGQLNEAVENYSKILAIVPDHEKAEKKRIECLKIMANRASSKGNLKDAESLFEQLLTIDQSNSEAKEKLQTIKNHHKELNDYLARSTSALRKKNYLAAMQSSKRALQMAPTHQSAVFRLKEAKRGLFMKRIMPAAIIFVLALAGAAIAPKFYIDMELDTAAAHIMSGEYEKAEQVLNSLEKIPFWGNKNKEQIADMKNQIITTRLNKKIEKAYKEALNSEDEKTIENFYKTASLIEKEYRNSKNLPEKTRISYIADIRLKVANLLYNKEKLKEALDAYNQYLDFSEKYKISAAQEAKIRSLGLAAFYKGMEFYKKEKLESATFHFQTALEKIPTLEGAKKALNRIEEKKVEMIKLIASAREAMREARDEKIYSNYEKKLQKAKAKALQILEKKPKNTEAENIIREVDWRLDAGENMVFFMLSPDKGFAIDRYEYPNKKGIKPISASFIEARKLAEKAGKKIPDIDTWRIAAVGVERRGWDYTWGTEFRKKHCNSSVFTPSEEVAPSGLFPAGATPEGLHDMCGNLSEWVDGGEGKNPEDAVAIGGNFSDSNPRDLTVSAIKTYPAGINNKKTGFRCVKFYSKKDNH